MEKPEKSLRTSAEQAISAMDNGHLQGSLSLSPEGTAQVVSEYACCTVLVDECDSDTGSNRVGMTVMLFQAGGARSGFRRSPWEAGSFLSTRHHG